MFSGKILDYMVDVSGFRLRVQTSSTVIYPDGTPVCIHLPADRCVVIREVGEREIMDP
jgi:hypothetical protein